MLIQEPVQVAIKHALNHYAYRDAIFLSERLNAEVNSDESLFLLATCYYRSGKPNRAYTVLTNSSSTSARCKLLLAQCCVAIHRLNEAETAIVGNIVTKAKSIDDVVAEFADMAPYALALLGTIYRRTDRLVKAAESFQRCLKLNPFLWSAYEALCQIGEKPDPCKIFQVSEQFNVTQNTHNPSSVLASPTVTNQSTPTGCDLNSSLHTPVEMTVEHTPLHLNIHSLALASVQQSSSESPMLLGSLNVDSPCPTTLITPDASMQMAPPPPTAPRRVRSVMKAGTRSMLSGTPTLLLTPSFGLFPLDTPSPDHTHTHSVITPNLTPGLIESHQIDAKAPVKKPMTRRSQQQQQQPPISSSSSTALLKPPVFSQSGNTRDVISTASPQTGLQANVPVVRRSSRLYGSSNSVKENDKNQTKNRFPSPRAPTRKVKSKISKSQQELNELNKMEMTPETKPATIASAQAQMVQMQKQSAGGLMALFRDIGRAYQALCQFECRRAIQLFSELPIQHANTGWIMCQIGKAYFELAEYKKAEKIFAEARQREPHHIQGMEIYSTTLWQLEREVTLSALGQDLTEYDKEVPESWCAVGNCFSLQKEHDTAIKFFQRAIQVDPNFSYAYTLLGHEYLLTEELEKAQSCFRSAIRVDSRRYNAWYGLGMIYYKQERFQLAELHYRKALAINPQSSVLLVHIGVVQHAMQKSDAALATLNKAVSLDPKNPLCKFHRASVLFANDKHDDALRELEELKEIVPKESLVYFLIGKVHKKLGQMDLAMMNFSWAMDLDPKGANNQIKEAIDAVPHLDNSVLEPRDLDDTNEAETSQDTSVDMDDTDDVQLEALESDESL